MAPQYANIMHWFPIWLPRYSQLPLSSSPSLIFYSIGQQTLEVIRWYAVEQTYCEKVIEANRNKLCETNCKPKKTMVRDDIFFHPLIRMPQSIQL